MIASSRTTDSSTRKSSCFTARSSYAASITTSQSARSASAVVRLSRPSAASRASCASVPFSTFRLRKYAIWSRACSARASSTSRPTVWNPASIASCAIPEPIAPRPTTPSLRISRATARDAIAPRLCVRTHPTRGPFVVPHLLRPTTVPGTDQQAPIKALRHPTAGLRSCPQAPGKRKGCGRNVTHL